MIHHLGGAVLRIRFKRKVVQWKNTVRISAFGHAAPVLLGQEPSLGRSTDDKLEADTSNAAHPAWPFIADNGNWQGAL